MVIISTVPSIVQLKDLFQIDKKRCTFSENCLYPKVSLWPREGRLVVAGQMKRRPARKLLQNTTPSMGSRIKGGRKTWNSSGASYILPGLYFYCTFVDSYKVSASKQLVRWKSLWWVLQVSVLRSVLLRLLDQVKRKMKVLKKLHPHQPVHRKVKGRSYPLCELSFGTATE